MNKTKVIIALIIMAVLITSIALVVNFTIGSDFKEPKQQEGGNAGSVSFKIVLPEESTDGT